MATSPVSRIGISRALPRPCCRSWMTSAIRLLCGRRTINQFPARFERYWHTGMRRKLGLLREEPDDVSLIHALLTLMQEHTADYTNTFRLLCAVAEGDAAPAATRPGIRWRRGWPSSPCAAGAATLMRAHNPAVIPRNHRVEGAIDAAVQQEDFALWRPYWLCCRPRLRGPAI